MQKKNGEQQDELNLNDEGVEEEEEEQESEEEEEGAEDRGDDVHPEDKDVKGLKSVAGEEEEEEEEDDQPAGGKKGSGHVPHARFNEVNEELKNERAERLRLEEELARARGTGGKKKPAEEEAPAFDFDGKEEAYADALMEGDKKKAAAIRKEINAELSRQAEERATEIAVRRVSAATAQSELSAAAAEMKAEYPFLDHKNKAANAEAIGDVLGWRDLYIGQGMGHGAALRKAVAKVAPLYTPKKGGKVVEEEEEEEEEQEEQQQGSGKPKLSLADLRKRRALERNADAAKRQPARLDGGAGDRSEVSKIKVEDLTEEEYEKLPAKVKQQLRGDNV
ncbi:MAG: hypothetical protein ACREVL_16480 [Solimonas sp.]